MQLTLSVSNKLNYLFLLLITLLTNPVWGQTKKRALFVGNSYTLFHDMPKMVADIALSKGDTLDWVMSVRGGYSLKSQMTRPAFYTDISNGNYDNIILQEHHILSGYPKQAFETESMPYIIFMKQLLENHQPCADLFYTIPWPKKNGNSVDCPTDIEQCSYEGILNRATSNFTTVKDSLDQPIIPLAIIWDRFRTNHPWLDLYMPSDSLHPNLAGSYLVACINFGVIFKKSPEGGTYPLGLSHQMATIIQNEAWEGLNELAVNWDIDLQLNNENAFVASSSDNNWSFVSKVRNHRSVWWQVDNSIFGDLDSIQMERNNNCPFNVKLFIKKGCDTLVFERQFSPTSGLNCSAIINNPICATSANGSITLQVTGGSTPYSINWQNGATSNQISNLNTGLYSATISDASGCTFNVNEELKPINSFSVALHPTSTCLNENSGFIIANINSNVQTGHQWQWSAGTSQNQQNLGVGSYTVTVTDPSGCTASAQTFISDVSELVEPKNLKYTDVGLQTIAIKWDASPCADSHIVFWKRQNNTSWSSQLVGNSVNNVFTIPNLVPGKKYNIFVTSKKNTLVLSSDTIVTGTLDTFFYDSDLDGFGTTSSLSFVQPGIKNFVKIAGDCDDQNSFVFPTSIEYCDNIDNNCNNQIDEGALSCLAPQGFAIIDKTTSSATFKWALSSCASGYVFRWKLNTASTFNEIILNGNTSTYTVNNLNLNDSIFCSVSASCGNTLSLWTSFQKVVITNNPFIINPATYTNNTICFNPWVLESCNGIDDNCNGIVDEGTVSTVFQDLDNDGFGGNLQALNLGCLIPLGYTLVSGDCNDMNINVFPNQNENCSNNLDDNCNNQIDESNSIPAYLDFDNDGFGAGALLYVCELQPGYSTNNCDCNDNNANMNPNAIEVNNNGADDDCNELVDDACTNNVSLTTVKKIQVSPTSEIILHDLVNDATTHQMQYRISGTTIWTIKTSNSGKFELNGLLPSTTYQFRFRTQCTTGLTTFTALSTFKTGAVTGVCVRPIIGGTHIVSPQSVNIHWNFANAATQYRLRYRINAPNSVWTIKTTSTPQISLAGLTPGLEYFWQVAAYCTSGGGTWTGYSTSLGRFKIPLATQFCSNSPIAAFVEAELTESALANHDVIVNDFFNNSNVSIFPNPTTAIFSVESHNVDLQKITVSDLTNRSLTTLSLSGLGAEMDMSEFPNGIYLLRIELINGSVITKKLVKQ